jgi:hypothetical protein
MIKKYPMYGYAPDRMVCSEEQAKQLKELGVLQESFFYLWDDHDGYGYKTITHGKWENGRTPTCSIYSDAELYAMLPAGVDVAKSKNFYSLSIEGPWCYKTDGHGLHDDFKWEKWPTPAQALASILIFLLTHKYLSIEQVNYWLQNHLA